MKIAGNIVEADGVKPSMVVIENGIFTQVGLPIDDPDVIYGSDCLIFPGFIDIHTHCREDVSGKDNHKEDYTTASLAAISGGVICVADMPNNPIPPVDKASYDAKNALAKRALIDILPYAGIGPATSPFGDVPYKAFMGPSTRSEDSLHFANNEQLSQTLERYANTSVSFHCESPVLLDLYKNDVSHEKRRPSVCEYAAIETACDLIQKYSLSGKICHVSTAAGIDIISKAKASGVNVTCEVTPHHLYFDVESITPENHYFLRMNPPLRTPAERQYLIEQLKLGKFDYLASDHAPHTTAEKLQGISGVPQLDTYGSFVAWLLLEAEVNPVVIFNMACMNPGIWISRFMPRKIGRIMPDYEANLTILNMRKTAVDGRPLFTKCHWSPFDLRKMPGLVAVVYHRGVKIVDGLYIKT